MDDNLNLTFELFAFIAIYNTLNLSSILPNLYRTSLSIDPSLLSHLFILDTQISTNFMLSFSVTSCGIELTSPVFLRDLDAVRIPLIISLLPPDASLLTTLWYDSEFEGLLPLATHSFSLFRYNSFECLFRY